MKLISLIFVSALISVPAFASPDYQCESKASQFMLQINSDSSLSLSTDTWMGSLQEDAATSAKPGYLAYAGTIAPVCNEGQMCPHWVRKSTATVQIDGVLKFAVKGKINLDGELFTCRVLMTMGN